MAIKDAINNARNIFNQSEEEKEMTRVWWDSLSVCWDKFKENEGVAKETFDKGVLYGSEMASEMTGHNWVFDLCDIRMWDMEEKMESWRELYQDILKLGYQAKDKKQLEAIKMLENVVYNACRELAKDMDNHESPKRYDDRANELVREPSRWEKSKLMMEYVEERAKDMTPQEALKLANLCDRRNKLPKDHANHMVFSFYVGTMVVLQGILVEKGWGKVKYRAQARLNWFLKQYDHWDIEEKLSEPEKAFQFNENMDSDEEDDPTDKVSANCYSVNVEAMIDLKNYCEREAEARGISRECVLTEIEDKQNNWL